MEGYLGYPAMHRPGVELAISRSQARRPDHYTTQPPAGSRREASLCKTSPAINAVALLGLAVRIRIRRFCAEDIIH